MALITQKEIEAMKVQNVDSKEIFHLYGVDGTKFWCKICDCFSDGILSTRLHLKGKRHRNSMSNYHMVDLLADVPKVVNSDCDPGHCRWKEAYLVANSALVEIKNKKKPIHFGPLEELWHCECPLAKPISSGPTLDHHFLGNGKSVKEIQDSFSLKFKVNQDKIKISMVRPAKSGGVKKNCPQTPKYIYKRTDEKEKYQIFVKRNVNHNCHRSFLVTAIIEYDALEVENATNLYMYLIILGELHQLQNPARETASTLS